MPANQALPGAVLGSAMLSQLPASDVGALQPAGAMNGRHSAEEAGIVQATGCSVFRLSSYQAIRLRPVGGVLVDQFPHHLASRAWGPVTWTRRHVPEEGCEQGMKRLLREAGGGRIDNLYSEFLA